ncbi:MAG: SDR family oxidoreductase [Caldilineaceae bacterium]
MILVVGATGQVGGAIAQRLLIEGRSVRVLLRPNSPSEQLAAQGFATPAAALTGAGAEPVTGDLRDRVSLDAAVRGVDVVITTANSAQRGGDDNPQTVDLDGNRNLVEAAAAAGVKQFVFVSASLADAGSPVPFLAAKGKTEDLLITGTMPYTILAPDAFMDFWLGVVVGLPALQGRPVILVGTGERKHSFIASRDVVAYATAVVDHPAARNRRLVFGGPQGVSYLDVVETFGRVLGRPLPVNHVAPGEPIPGMPDAVIPLAASFDMYDAVLPGQELADEFGVQLTTVEQFARAMVGQGADR